jgi:hypothetical protein
LTTEIRNEKDFRVIDRPSIQISETSAKLGFSDFASFFGVVPIEDFSNALRVPRAHDYKRSPSDSSVNHDWSSKVTEKSPKVLSFGATTSQAEPKAAEERPSLLASRPARLKPCVKQEGLRARWDGSAPGNGSDMAICDIYYG